MRILVALSLLSAPASAQDCTGNTQRELNECAGDALAAADTALNKTYQTITVRLADSPLGRAKLIASERAWIKFRDAECAFEASGVEGGSIQPMIEAECRASLTMQRQTRLAAFLTCAEGDLSCPVPAK